MNRSTYYGLALIISLTLLSTTEGTRDFTIDITNFTINVMRPEYVAKYRYSIVQKHLITAEYVWAKNITAFRIHVHFDMVNKANRRISLIKVDADGCKLIQSVYRSKLIQSVLKEMMRSGGMPKKCPILTTQPFFVANYTVQPDHFPPFMPNTKFITNVSFHVKNMAVAEMVMEGDVHRF